MTAPVLELMGIAKAFGAIQALTGVDLALGRGEVLGLMGDNGAGKSTLVKIIAGSFAPSAGEMLLDGEAVRFARPVEARRAGIEIVYQDLALCDNLSAALNVFLGRELVWRLGPLRFLDHAAMNARAGELFAELKSETRPRALVKSMSGGQRQAVAIARTRLADPKIVLMDEPTAAISVRQVAEVLDLIRHLQGDRACGGADLAPHARRVRGRRPGGGAAAGAEGGGQADRVDLAGGGDRADHRGDRGGVKASR